MEALPYLLKASLGMVAFYGLYWLILRWQTYFFLNRVYLLTALLVALGAPLIELSVPPLNEPLPVDVSMTPTDAAPLVVPVMLTAPAYDNVTEVMAQVPTTIDWAAVLWWIYAVGVLLLLGRLGLRLYQIGRIVQQAERFDMDGMTIVLTSQPAAPTFSFLHYLVVNPHDYAQHFDTILPHEQVHIRQRHSLDLLWVEVVQVFFWFNPVLIFYKRSLRQIHEYLADNQTTDSARFRHAERLFAYALQVQALPLTNSFLDSTTLKNRIKMLYQKRSSRWVLGRYIFALPMLVGLVALVAARVAELPLTPELNPSDTTAEVVVVASQLQRTTDTLKEVTITIKPTLSPDSIYGIVEEQPTFKGSLITYINRNLKYPDAARRANIEGKVFINFVITADGKVAQPKVLKGIGFGCDEEALRIVSNMPDWEPGRQKGKDVAVRFNIPIIFSLPAGARTANPDNLPPPPPGTSFNMNEATFVIDGEVATKEQMNTIDPAQIKSISILKDKNSLSKYGAIGSKGVVMITRKNEYRSPFSWDKITSGKISIGADEQQKDLTPAISNLTAGEWFKKSPPPLYLMDGQTITQDLFNNNRVVDKKNVREITVYRGEDALQKFGEKGRNGVVELVMKDKIVLLKNPKTDETAYVKIQKDVKNADKIPSINFEIDGDEPDDKSDILDASIRYLKPLSNPVFLVDGKEITEAQFYDRTFLVQANVKSISIYKPEKGLRVFGEMGRNGVVAVTMKKTK